MATKKATSRKTTTSKPKVDAPAVASKKPGKKPVASSPKKAVMKKSAKKGPSSNQVFSSAIKTTKATKAIKVIKAIDPPVIASALLYYLVPHESIDPGILGNDDVHDETDYAQWMQLVEQAEIAKRAREMSRTIVNPNFDGVHCVDCDCEIPAKRIEYGFDRCVDCKQVIEDEQARQKRLAG